MVSAGASLPDLLGPDVRLLFVGINPGLTAVATQIPFAGRGNRFYRALHLAGIIDHAIEAAAGIDHADVERLLARGIGIASLVARDGGHSYEDASAFAVQSVVMVRNARRYELGVVASVEAKWWRKAAGEGKPACRATASIVSSVVSSSRRA